MKPLNALIVLGGGLTDDDKLNVHTKLRYDKALKIQKDYDYIICSSGNSYRKENKHKISEAEAGKKYLIKKGVNPNKILIEDESKDTLSNAYYCRLILDKLDLTNFAIITSRFHMKKAKFVFRVVFPKDKYKIRFIKSKNGISRLAVRNRNISEPLVVKFYKNHLFTTYKIRKGNMRSIEKFLKYYNLATSGKMDAYQQELTDKVNKKIDRHSPLLY